MEEAGAAADREAAGAGAGGAVAATAGGREEQPQASWQLCVSNLAGPLCSVAVQAGSSLRHVKETIEAQTGISHLAQNLVYLTQELASDSDLAALPRCGEVELTLVRRSAEQVRAALRADARGGDDDAIQLLASVAGGSALVMAAHHGVIRAVRALLAAGAEEDYAGDKGQTPLQIAARQGHGEVVRALLAARANPDRSNDLGGRPLHRAAYQGHQEVVAELLAASAQVSPLDRNGCTPLKLAELCGNFEVATLLVQAGGQR